MSPLYTYNERTAQLAFEQLRVIPLLPIHLHATSLEREPLSRQITANEAGIKEVLKLLNFSDSVGVRIFTGHANKTTGGRAKSACETLIRKNELTRLAMSDLEKDLRNGISIQQSIHKDNAFNVLRTAAAIQDFEMGFWRTDPKGAVHGLSQLLNSDPDNPSLETPAAEGAKAIVTEACLRLEEEIKAEIAGHKRLHLNHQLHQLKLAKEGWRPLAPYHKAVAVNLVATASSEVIPEARREQANEWADTIRRNAVSLYQRGALPPSSPAKSLAHASAFEPLSRRDRMTDYGRW